MPLKTNSFISKVKMKFRQKLWSNFFKILIFWYQSRDQLKDVDRSTSSLIFANSTIWQINSPDHSRDHFKNVDCSTSSLYSLNSIFWQINGSKKETPHLDSSNQIWTKVMKSLLQNIDILVSVTWLFQKCGLQYFQLIFAKFDLLTNKRI